MTLAQELIKQTAVQRPGPSSLRIDKDGARDATGRAQTFLRNHDLSTSLGSVCSKFEVSAGSSFAKGTYCSPRMGLRLPFSSLSPVIEADLPDVEVVQKQDLASW